MDGPIDPHDIPRVRGEKELQRYLVDETEAAISGKVDHLRVSGSPTGGLHPPDPRCMG
jgi:hypothetical protein